MSVCPIQTCQCAPPAHVCVCGRQCSNIAVLRSHIHKYITDKRHHTNGIVCTDDAHGWQLKNRRETSAKELNTEYIDEVDETCKWCEVPFESVAAVAAEHRAAHANGRHWCFDCRTDVGNTVHTIGRHYNSQGHGRRVDANLLAKLQSSAFSPRRSAPSDTVKRRLHVTDTASSKRALLESQAVDDEQHHSSFDDEPADTLEMGAGCDVGDTDNRTGDDLLPADDADGANDADHAPDMPVPLTNDGQSGAAGDAVRAAVGKNAADLEREFLFDAEQLSDDESDEEVESDDGDKRDRRATCTMSFIPAPPRPLPYQPPRLVVPIVAPTAPVECNDETFELIAWIDKQSGVSRDAARALVANLHSHGYPVPPTLEAARIAALERAKAAFVSSPLRAVQVPVLASFPQPVHDQRPYDVVTFRDPVYVLVNALAARRDALRRALSRNVTLKEAAAGPTLDQLAAGSAAYAKWHNGGTPINDTALLPPEAPESPLESASMYELHQLFDEHLRRDAAVVSISIGWDGTMAFRKTEMTPLRMRFSFDPDSRQHELCAIAEAKHSMHEICWLVADPCLAQFRDGIRVTDGDDFVDVFGALGDICLDKKAAASFLLLGDRAPAIFSTAAAGGDEWRAVPMRENKLTWRSMDAMASAYNAAVNVAATQSLTAANKHLKQIGMQLLVRRDGTVLRPFWMSEQLALFRRCGCFRLFACTLHQLRLGILVHVLTKMIRSLSTNTAKKLNLYLRSMPRCANIEHINGGLFRSVKSTKGSYYDAMLATMSGKQKWSAAVQLAAILDDVGGDSARFAPMLSAYLLCDDAFASGHVAEGLSRYHQFLNEVENAPLTVPPSRKFAALRAGSEHDRRRARRLMFVDLPKHVDMYAMALGNTFVGPPGYTSASALEVAHQEFKDDATEHAPFRVDAVNVSSLNRRDRADAAAAGAVALAASVAAQRQRSSPGSGGGLTFIDAGSSIVDVQLTPSGLAECLRSMARSENVRVDALRIGRLRVKLSDSSTTTVAASTQQQPAFLAIQQSGTSAEWIVEVLRVWYARTTIGNRSRSDVVLECLEYGAHDVEKRSYKRLDVKRNMFLPAARVSMAKIMYVSKHLCDQVLWFDLFSK